MLQLMIFGDVLIEGVLIVTYIDDVFNQVDFCVYDQLIIEDVFNELVLLVTYKLHLVAMSFITTSSEEYLSFL